MKKTLILITLFIHQVALADFLPNSFTAGFSQEYVSSLKGKTKKGTGTIEYKFPGNIRFETLNPTHVLFITNGAKSWYYTFPFIEGEKGELSEVTTKDGNGMFSKFFDSLKNGLKSNSIYDAKKESDKTLIIFKSKPSKEIGVKNAKLFFENNKEEFAAINAIDFELLDGKKVSMKLNDLKLNPSIDNKRFNFDLNDYEKKVPQKN